ncbi:hypothetical protein D3C72_2456970 [compost metagenome]
MGVGETEIPLQHVCNLAVEHLEGGLPGPGKRGNGAFNKRIKGFCEKQGLEVRLSSRYNKSNAIQVPDPEAALLQLLERFPSVNV